MVKLRPAEPLLHGAHEPGWDDAPVVVAVDVDAEVDGLGTGEPLFRHQPHQVSGLVSVDFPAAIAVHLA